MNSLPLPLPRCHAHIWSKKTSILSTLHYIMGQNSHLDAPFFSDFSRKNHYSHVHILSKKRPFFKKHGALMSIHYQKNVNSLKNTMLPRHFVVLIFPKIMKKNHHTNGIESIFSFDYLLNRKKIITVSFKSPYPYPLRLSSAYALRYAITGPQKYLWSFDIIS